MISLFSFCCEKTHINLTVTEGENLHCYDNLSGYYNRSNLADSKDSLRSFKEVSFLQETDASGTMNYTRLCTLPRKCSSPVICNPTKTSPID